jgi:hypothetical protein
MADDRPVVVTTGGGAGWFIVGALVVAALVAIWLFGGGMFDRSASGPGEINVDVNLPKVDKPAQ